MIMLLVQTRAGTKPVMWNVGLKMEGTDILLYASPTSSRVVCFFVTSYTLTAWCNRSPCDPREIKNGVSPSCPNSHTLWLIADRSCLALVEHPDRHLGCSVWRSRRTPWWSPQRRESFLHLESSRLEITHDITHIPDGRLMILGIVSALW